MESHGGTQEDWSQYALVVPVVSVGNVGQLAADLLIATLELRKCGNLHHFALLPAVGSAAFAHVPSALTFGLELFYDPARKLACLQQRAPAAPGLQLELATDMAAWIAQAGFKQVWVLGSLDAVFRGDAQLAGQQLRYWCRDESLAAACKAQQALAPLEESWFQRSGDKPLEDRLLPPWPLLRACEEAGLPAAALLAFCLEGDNRPEAYMLAAVAAAVLGLVQQQAQQGEEEQEGAAAAVTAPLVTGLPAGGGLAWKQPPSWQHVFGVDRPEVY